MDRRSFLKTLAGLGGAALSAGLAQACRLATPARATEPPMATGSVPSATGTAPEATPGQEPQPEIAPTCTATTGPERARVAFVKTDDRAAGVRRALEVLDFKLAPGQSLFLKPNFNSADPAPGSTHNDTLQAMVEKLRALGAASITVGDRSGMGDTRAVMQRKGIFRLAQELGLEVVVFDELDAADWVRFQPQGAHWSRGFAVARPLPEADVLAQTCCLKTHRFGGHLTLALKNSVGAVAKFIPGEGYNYMRELHASPDQRSMIAEINVACRPDLIVLDGVEAFVEGGPDRGRKVAAEVVLAGTDPVAIDAVGVALLRYFGTTPAVSRGRIFEQEQIARAVELGLGVSRPEGIELVADDEASRQYAAQIREVLMQG